MRNSGIHRLELSPVPGLAHLLAAERLEEVLQVFPDEMHWLDMFAAAFHVDDLSNLCRKLEYEGPPELLSGFLCLYCGKVGPISGSAAEWRGKLEEYVRQHGVVPHPAVLFKWGRSGGSGGSVGGTVDSDDDSQGADEADQEEAGQADAGQADASRPTVPKGCEARLRATGSGCAAIPAPLAKL